jgi:hypothetical protein
MKRTTTRTSEVWGQCTCGGGFANCPLCKGTGRFLSETRTETIIEETTGSLEEAIDAEEVEDASLNKLGIEILTCCASGGKDEK